MILSLCWSHGCLTGCMEQEQEIPPVHLTLLFESLSPTPRSFEECFRTLTYRCKSHKAAILPSISFLFIFFSLHSFPPGSTGATLSFAFGSSPTAATDAAAAVLFTSFHNIEIGKAGASRSVSHFALYLGLCDVNSDSKTPWQLSSSS